VEVAEGQVQFVIIYLKIHEDKESIVFNGPFYGEIRESKGEAEKAARDLANETRSGAVVSKIFRIGHNAAICEAMDQARPIFDRIRKDILDAKDVVDRPVQKKSKKKKA